MVKQVALLRGVNVGGSTSVRMADLREMLTELGFRDAASLLQSGNLAFDAGRRPAAALERLLEAETASRLGKSFDYFVRSADELAGIVERNPFPHEAQTDPGHLVVMFLKRVPAADRLGQLTAAIQGREAFRHDGKHLYIVYPDGIGRSKFSAAVIERQLALRGTARNWNTVRKLLALCAPV